MKMKTKSPVFTADRVTTDMLMLLLQAVAVGAAAALLAAAVIAGLVALAA